MKKHITVIFYFFLIDICLGQILIKDINPGSEDGLRLDNSMEVVSTNDWVYFIANNGVSTEIWRTDGTNQNTVQVSNFTTASSVYVYPIVNDEAYFGGLVNGRLILLRLKQPNALDLSLVDSISYQLDNVYISSLQYFDGYLYFIGSDNDENNSIVGSLYSIKLSSGQILQIPNATDIWFLNSRNLPRGNFEHGDVQNELVLNDQNLFFLQKNPSNELYLIEYNTSTNQLDTIQSAMVLYSRSRKMNSPPILFTESGNTTIYFSAALGNVFTDKVGLFKYTIGTSQIQHIVNSPTNDEYYPYNFVKFNDTLYFDGAANNQFPTPDFVIYRISADGVIASITTPSNFEYKNRVLGNNLTYIHPVTRMAHTLPDLNLIPNLTFCWDARGLINLDGNYLYWLFPPFSGNLVIYKNNCLPFMTNFKRSCDCFDGNIIRLHDNLIFFAEVTGTNIGLELYKVPTSLITSNDKLEKEELEIEVYPNPVIDNLEVHIPDFNHISKIEIFNSEGSRVILEELNFNSINLANLFSGLYIMKLYCNDKLHVKKFIKY